jgi:hypothetical protein
MTYDPNHDPGSPLGYDVDVDTDMQPDGRACSGARLVGNAILHRLTEDALPLTGAPGSLAPYGVDVRKWIGQVTTASQALAKGPQLAAVISRDQRVDPSSIAVLVTVAPSVTFANGSAVDLAIQVSARTTTQLPISLVFGISAATVELLAAGT